MKAHLYEILWHLETDAISSLYSEFKIFSSEAQARRFGKRHQRELNDGASIDRRAQDGYYFKYFCVQEINEIDGFRVNLEKITEGDKQCNNSG